MRYLAMYSDRKVEWSNSVHICIAKYEYVMYTVQY
jgi:hypothetical protein